MFLIILGICYWWFKCCTHPINVNDKVLQKEKEITIDNVNCRVKKLEVVVEKWIKPVNNYAIKSAKRELEETTGNDNHVLIFLK